MGRHHKVLATSISLAAQIVGADLVVGAVEILDALAAGPVDAVGLRDSTVGVAQALDTPKSVLVAERPRRLAVAVCSASNTGVQGRVADLLLAAGRAVLTRHDAVATRQADRLRDATVIVDLALDATAEISIAERRVGRTVAVGRALHAHTLRAALVALAVALLVARALQAIAVVAANRCDAAAVRGRFALRPQATGGGAATRAENRRPAHPQRNAAQLCSRCLYPHVFFVG